MDTIKQIERDYEHRKGLFSNLDVRNYTDEGKIYAKYIIGSIPLMDTNLTQDVLDDYVHQAEATRHYFNEDISLADYCEYVVQPKVNNEALDLSRKYFNDLVSKFVDKESMLDTVLAINKWIIGVVQYRSTDARTKNATFTYESGTGRCGEKSTFMTQLCRSVGIPARQIYAPWWSHSDDRHAWVEVLIDNKWQFLGAGDSEVELNRGWFKAAASRAISVHANHFSNLHHEEHVLDDTYGQFKRLNVTSNYTEVRTVKVTNNIKGIDVLSFDLINYGSFRSMFKRKVAYGETIEIHVGHGMFYIRAENKDAVYMVTVSDDQSEYTIEESDILNESVSLLQDVRNAIVESDVRDPKITQIIADNKAEELKKYHARMEGIDSHPINQKEIDKLESIIGKENSDRMLKQLTDKDVQDFKHEVLVDHYEAVKDYESQFDKEIYESYILNPRVSYETLSRSSKELKALKLRTIEEIVSYVEQHIQTLADIRVPDTIMAANRMIETQTGDPFEKDILTVSILRVMGIPSYYENNLGIVMVYENNQFRPLKEGNQWNLELKASDETVITIRHRSSTVTMGPMPRKENIGTQLLPEGSYEIVASFRLPNGKLIASTEVVDLDKDTSVDMTLPEVDPSTMIENTEVEDLLEELGDIHHKGLIIVGNIDEEPTQHIVNELLEINHKPRILVLDKNTKHELYQKLEKHNDAIELREMNDDWGRRMARRCFREPGVFPLVVFYKDGKTILSNSGYRVGFMKYEWVYRNMEEK